jgi:hypothetical protein
MSIQRNLKAMIEMGLSAIREKEGRLQGIKKEVIEMIGSRVRSLQAQVIHGFLLACLWMDHVDQYALNQYVCFVFRMLASQKTFRYQGLQKQMEMGGIIGTMPQKIKYVPYTNNTLRLCESRAYVYLLPFHFWFLHKMLLNWL